jgi:hypothetical protein
MCHPLAVLPISWHDQYYSHHISCTHYVGCLLAVSVCTNHKLCHHWTCATDFPVAVCHQVAMLAVCRFGLGCCHHVLSTRCATPMATPTSFQAPHIIHSTHRSSGHLPYISVATDHVIAPLSVFLPHQLSSCDVQSTDGTAELLTKPTSCSPGT